MTEFTRKDLEFMLFFLDKARAGIMQHKPVSVYVVNQRKSTYLTPAPLVLVDTAVVAMPGDGTFQGT